MDPLSITVSAVSLAQSTAKISVWLYELVKDVKNVDSRICELSKEVTRLTDLLTSVEHMVQQCQSQALTLAHLDEDMWNQIRTALSDCEVNINGLNTLLMDLCGETESSAGNFSRLLRKPSMHFKISLHKEEIDDFTSKIYKSNCAIQTSLAVVSVSLTFRTNVSQENLFQELHHLKGLVQESLRVAHRQEVNPDSFSARLNKNLVNLANAAQSFHSRASSAASTQYVEGDRRSMGSNWGGSDFGGITDALRERIERWNDLATINESAEDSMTEVTFDSSHDDSVTTLASSVTEDVPRDGNKDKAQVLAEEEEEESDDDEDDIALDFLRNFEELAYSSFMAKDYSKAEQFLRMAVERSTGDSGTGFKQLKMQLALCCCLQGKWDHASGIISALRKTKSASNLPIFHLLQAIALAHLEGDRLSEAYDTCKTVLQGKKKIIGNRNHDYNECLWVFAAICEKRGDALEAEAVRHSIPRGWTPTPGNVESPTLYLINHESLIKSIFCEKDQGDQNGDEAPKTPTSPQSPTSSEQISSTRESTDNWRTLVPNTSSDGLTRAERDERRGTTIYESDTGKEFVVQIGSVPNPAIAPANVPNIQVPTNEYIQAHPRPGMFAPPPAFQAAQNFGFNYTPQTQEQSSEPRRPAFMLVPPAVTSGLPPRPISPKKHGQSKSADLSRRMGPTSPQHLHPHGAFSEEENSPLGRRHSQPSRNASTREASRQELAHDGNAEVPAGQSQNPEPDVASAGAPSRTTSGRVLCRPVSHQRLIDRVQEAQGVRPAQVPDDPIPQVERSGSPLPFIEQVNKGLGDEFYSTLEVVHANDAGAGHSGPDPSKYLTPFSSYLQPTTRVNAALDLPCLDRSRKRWTVQKDIGNVGGLRPLGSFSSQFLPVLRKYPDPESHFIGVSVRFEATTSIALNSGYEAVTICNLPMNPSSSLPTRTSSLSMRKFARKMNPYLGRRQSPLTDTSSFTVDVPQPRNWIIELGPEMQHERHLIFSDERSMRSQCETEAQNIEHTIATLLRQGQPSSPSDTFSSLRLEGLTFAVPDYFVRTFWNHYMSILSECALMQHAKVVPHSLAVVQYYIDCGALVFDQPSLDTPSHVVVVLNCDETLMDCSPHVLQLTSHDYVEVHDIPCSYMAELAGCKHAQAEFAKLVEQQLELTLRQLRRKVDTAIVDSIIRSCCEQFQQYIIPGFEDNGIEWTVNFEMPGGLPGFQHGQLKFTNAEILQCLSSSVAMARKMLAGTIVKLHGLNYKVSNVLLSGSYSRSKYVATQLRETTDNLGRENGSAIHLLQSMDSHDVCSLGALSFAINS